MKAADFIFLPVIVGLASCWHQQWEDRVAADDTGSVTRGKVSQVDISTYNLKESRGEILFTENCASCHIDHKKNKGIRCGQGLENIFDRIPGGDWKYYFLRNADSLRERGDGYANTIFLMYNKTRHPRFPNFSNEQIDTILIYANASR